MKKKKLLTLFATLCMALMLCPVTAFAYAEPEPTPTPEATPEPVIEEATPEGTPFSVPGNGEILDDITDDPTKDFLTVTTANGNTFFLVIDRSQNTENVYMLSMIDELDLQDHAEEDGQADKHHPAWCWRNLRPRRNRSRQRSRKKWKNPHPMECRFFSSLSC